MGEYIYCRAEINNMPKDRRHGYMVIRVVNAELWYYGTYIVSDKAKEVAEEIGNGIVLEV